MRIAVIGSGISGLLAARLLSTRYAVTLYEAGHYLGGHANTVDVDLGGERFAVDTGFMVFNHRTYPNFTRMLDLLRVPSRASDMTFSVRCDSTGLEYQGGSLSGLFAQRRNFFRPRFWSMLRDILRFNRQALVDVQRPEFARATLGEYLTQRRFGQGMKHQYLYPMIAAIWSASPQQVEQFPLHFLVGFFRNHGLLTVSDQPRWRTIVGGSRVYINALLASFAGDVHVNCPIQRVTRHLDGVEVVTADGQQEMFDQVVLATHADQSLAMLSDADELETEILSAFPYQDNHAVLHTDPSLLPKQHRARASWNYHVSSDADSPATVTYDLSRLQGHRSQSPILLTLNQTESIAAAKIHREFNYAHPAYSLDSIAAQTRHGEISGRRQTHFCGAYWGYGFHEDGVNSALAVAKHFDIELSACTAPSIKARSLTSGTAL